MRILFLDCTTTPYDGNTLSQKPLGGIEGVTVALANTFAMQGHDVTVINNNSCKKPYVIDGVIWSNYQLYNFRDKDSWPDIVIANNDATLFNYFPDMALKENAKLFLWLHNPVSLFRWIKKKRFFAVMKWRPKAVFVGDKQSLMASSLIPFDGRYIIHHGLGADFLNPTVPLNDRGRDKQVIYFSQAYRGLAEVIECWVKFVHPADEGASLKVFSGDVELSQYGIEYTKEYLRAHNVKFMPKVPKGELIQSLSQSRAMVYPGHIDETFCLAASEASALGVPVVSYGRGALSERVHDGQNGFLVEDSDQKSLAHYVLLLLNDDDLFEDVSKKSREVVENMAWLHVANKWKEIFLNG